MAMGHFSSAPPEPPRLSGFEHLDSMAELAKAFNATKFAEQIETLKGYIAKCEEYFKLAGAVGEIMRLREAAKQAYQKAQETTADAQRQAQRLKSEATKEGEAELLRRKKAMDVTTADLVDRAQAAADRNSEMNDRQIEIERLSARLNVRADDLDERGLNLKDEGAKLAEFGLSLAAREKELNQRLAAFAALRAG